MNNSIRFIISFIILFVEITYCQMQCHSQGGGALGASASRCFLMNILGHRLTSDKHSISTGIRKKNSKGGRCSPLTYSIVSIKNNRV